MSTDRELLELAAKAAGLNIVAHHQAARDAAGFGESGLWIEGSTCWNPLTDDGDALRLALLTGTNVFRGMAENRTGRHFATAAVVAADLCAATRLAIVRAAAAIAKEKQPCPTLK